MPASDERTMLNRFRWLLLTLVVVVAIAASCTSESTDYQYALIQATCAPWDGPALQLTLADEPLQCQRDVKGAYLMLGVWRGLPIHAGQTVKFSPKENNGFGSVCKKAAECQAAESGEITFDHYDEGKGATGHYELHFRNGKTLTGHFDAKWCYVRMFCG